jgi:ubiquinone/menaquinone biosynthesis C-methylase UbiE
MSNSLNNELERISQEYKKRDTTINTNTWKTSIYHSRHSLGRLFYEHNRSVFIEAINLLNIDLEDKFILDVGCGDGNWLRMLIELGANPQSLTGIDLSEQRLKDAKDKNALINYIHNQQPSLSCLSLSHDIVMQTVVFSSILDQDLVQHLAQEMERVLKNNGYIIWLDNKKAFPPRLAGYSQEKVLQLFPNFKLVYCVPVHPRYFRKLHKNYTWLAKLAYEFTKIWCDGLLIILQKGDNND